MSAPTGGDQYTLRIFDLFRDDVDDTIDSVGAPNAGSWPANHFNALNIFENRILRIPVHTRRKRGQDCPAIDHDQQFVSESLVEPSGCDCPLIGINLRDIQTGYHS